MNTVELPADKHKILKGKYGKFLMLPMTVCVSSLKNKKLRGARTQEMKNVLALTWFTVSLIFSNRQ